MEPQIEKTREGQNILKIPTRHLNILVPASFWYLIFTNFHVVSLWFPTVPRGYPWLSLVIPGYPWLYLVIPGNLQFKYM